MARKQGIVYMTDGLARIGFLIEGQPGGDVTEQRIQLSHSPEDSRRFPSFLESSGFSPERVVLCVPRSRASVRFLFLPTQDEREIRAMVGYEAAAFFPYKPEEFVFSHTVLEKLPSGGVRVLVAAVQHQVLRWYIDFVKRAGIHPEEVWVSTQALYRSFLRKPRVGNTCLCHLDDGFAELLFFRDETLVFNRVLGLAAESAAEGRLMREMLAAQGYACGLLAVCGASGEFREFVDGLARGLGCVVAEEASCSVVNGMAADARKSLQLNLLPEDLKADKVSSERRKRLGLICCLVLLNLFLAADLVFVRYTLKRRYLSGLQVKIAAMDSQTVALQKKTARLRAYEHSAGSGSRKLALLSELASVCPGQVFLRSLDISEAEKKGIMVVSGKAKDVDTVLRFASALKGSPRVSATDVSYISKRPDAGGWVDFEIKAGY